MLAVDLMKPTKIIVGHYVTNAGGGWYLHKVLVTCLEVQASSEESTETYSCTCNRFVLWAFYSIA